MPSDTASIPRTEDDRIRNTIMDRLTKVASRPTLDGRALDLLFRAAL